MDLIDAAKNGDINKVRVLLDLGEDPNITNDYGLTSLIWASMRGYIDIVRLLLDNGADPNITNGNTALMKSSYNGHIDIVESLLRHGADPNITNNVGETALMKTVQKGHIDIVESLLRRGADPNIRDNNGETALIRASIGGYIDIVRLLLDNGADPNIKGYEGLTALIWASRVGHSRIDIVRLLLDNGADPSIIGDEGYTALMIAERRGHDDVARLIRDHIDLQKAKQNLAFATSFKSRDTPLNYFDPDIMKRLMGHTRKYNPSVYRRIRDERRRDPLTKSKQRLVSMRAMHSREGPIGSVRYDPSIMEGIGRHLTSMRPDAGVQRRMIEDKQMGSGKRSGKHRRKYYTKKRF